jgi:hypothetical protein
VFGDTPQRTQAPEATSIFSQEVRQNSLEITDIADGGHQQIKTASPAEEEQWKCQQVTGHEVKLLTG